MTKSPQVPPTQAAIQADGLTKRFGSTRAVDGLDLTVPLGGVFGLLGPNGAGKTTTIRILATLTRPDAGAARVLGHDVRTDPAGVRARIGLTGQFAALDASLTGMENLLLQARLLGLGRQVARRRAGELLEAFDLTDASRRVVKTYSGGMRRRLDVAASIVLQRPLLFLDEPTTGLDPHSRNQVWEMVRRLVRDGTTVLLTTQYLEEADQLSSHLAVLDRGTIIASGTPGELKALTGSTVLRVQLADPRDRACACSFLAQALGAEVRPEPDPATLTARTTARDGARNAGDPAAGDPAARALFQLSRAGIAVQSFALSQPSLDAVFLALTRPEASENAAAESRR